MSPEIVKNIGKILNDLPKDSPEFQATSDLMDKLLEFFQTLQDVESKELDRFLSDIDKDEQPLLQTLGKLVRKFHTQIKTVSAEIPTRLGEMAEHDMVSATQRLEHIVEMTEEAANTTMGLTESLLETMGEQFNANGALLEKLEEVLASEDLKPKVKKIVKETAAALKKGNAKEEEVQQKLTEILMAQGYQDLTGQVVQKIIALLRELEGELLGLVKTFGVTNADEKDTDKSSLEGPLSEKAESRITQDDADELLKSLGF